MRTCEGISEENIVIPFLVTSLYVSFQYVRLPAGLTIQLLAISSSVCLKDKSVCGKCWWSHVPYQSRFYLWKLSAGFYFQRSTVNLLIRQDCVNHIDGYWRDNNVILVYRIIYFYNLRLEYKCSILKGSVPFSVLIFNKCKYRGSVPTLLFVSLTRMCSNFLLRGSCSNVRGGNHMDNQMFYQLTGKERPNSNRDFSVSVSFLLLWEVLLSVIFSRFFAYIKV